MLPEISDPGVLAALREHREDRDALLSSLKASLHADERVRAVWLWGSFGRGEADDLSDLDPWIVVADEYVGELGASLRRYAQRTGNFLSGGEAPQNGPPGGGFFSALHAGRQGLLHLDCYWQPLSTADATSERAVLFDRRAEPMREQTRQSILKEAAPVLTEQEERIAHGIEFAWMMFSIAAKNLARHPNSDLGLMLYPRPGLEEAALLLGLEAYWEASDWISPEKPLDKVERLRHVTDKAARLAEATPHHRLHLSPQSAACLARYLALVKNIVAMSAA